MSLLQKLEQLYNGLIRLLTVLLTLALLGVAFKAALDWRRATAPEPELKAASAAPAKTPKVAAADVVKRVVANQSGTEADAISATDPHRAAYDRIGKAIRAFVQKQGATLEEEEFTAQLNAIHYKVSAQDTDALKAAYANGLADAFEQSLADPKIDALLAKRPEGDLPIAPMTVVGDVVDQYDTVFSEQNTASGDSPADGYLAQKEKQDAAWRSLVRAGGPILLLILVLQLLTFGRIERNTRAWTDGAR
ncbi:hypothetical protein RKE25_01930 [Dyella sp. BiH032]|uniref:hypothetical protein n=1 Tax=Dyella sp. BiH032 TaxID=3075430 RepID=UPI0028931B88|nr:hypothetical protein [Dyella sp. BiH032]WNL46420.1 hypothetical protein RKE25_01930 [Dyella sp. BiH032]